MDIGLCRLIELQKISDSRGSLVSLERGNGVPFLIQRIYYIFDTAHEASRGYHAHKSLSQLAVCIKGSCRFILDDGFSRSEISLDSATKGLLIEGLIWREIYDFSSDCVLLVLASERYDETDYIRNYDNFLNLVR